MTRPFEIISSCPDLIGLFSIGSGVVSIGRFLNKVFVGFHYRRDHSNPDVRLDDEMSIFGLRDKPASDEPDLSRTIGPGRNEHEVRTVEADGEGGIRSSGRGGCGR